MSDAKSPRTVAVGILKGGMGKSTTSINTARELAERGNDVLLIDLDPNGHTTTGLGFGDEFYADEDLGDVILETGSLTPSDIIIETDFDVDILPSNNNIESVEHQLATETMGFANLRTEVVDPLLGDVYDYVLIDCPASRGKLNDSALYAAGNVLIPIRPESGALSGVEKTVKRLIAPARKHFDVSILSVVPTDFTQRIDHNRSERRLLEKLVGRDHLRELLPAHAYVEPEFFDAVDAGEWDDNLPKPGIRHRAAINDSIEYNMPLRDYAPDCDQLERYDELAQIVETGEVDR
ncbi:ParA family protein (plasmid) [Haloferax sp. S1W]|uniref:ParA family protein n=1 Tax=Haloferax sp. S1W TaxID=3377110 RepID=UPI0037CC8AF0